MTIDGLLRLATMAAAASGQAGSIGRTTGRMTAAVLCASLAAVSAIAAGGCAAATLWLFAGARRWLGCRKRRSQTVSKIPASVGIGESISLHSRQRQGVFDEGDGAVAR
jgi:hypothetical protein